MAKKILIINYAHKMKEVNLKTLLSTALHSLCSINKHTKIKIT